VQDSKVQIGLAGQQFAGDSGFGLAGGDQVDVLPSGEEIEVVP
jgi:hypothetical protein